MKIRFNIPRKRKTNVWRERRNAKCGITAAKDRGVSRRRVADCYWVVREESTGSSGME